MTEWSDYLILDILTELSFGKSFETKEPGENLKKGIPHSVVRYLKLMYPVSPQKKQQDVLNQRRALTSSIWVDYLVALLRHLALAQAQGTGQTGRKQLARR